jgi:hypothetical protein
MRWLDKIPYWILVLAALALGLTPLGGEPHLIEKLRLLREGALTRAIDIFDLLMHGAPAALLMLKLARDGFRLGAGDERK